MRWTLSRVYNVASFQVFILSSHIAEVASAVTFFQQQPVNVLHGEMRGCRRVGGCM